MQMAAASAAVADNGNTMAVDDGDNGAAAASNGSALAQQSTQQQRKRSLHNSSRSVVNVAGYDVEGVSVGGQETSIVLPQLKLAMDIGRCPQRAVYMPTLLITHAHMDHIGGLPFHIATRSLFGLTPSQVCLPPAIAAGVEQLLSVHRSLDGSDMPCTLTSIAPGERVALPCKPWWTQPFRTVHPVPSQGYILYLRKSKLKRELVGLPSNAIRDMKQRGEEVTETIETPEIAFTGDTSIEFVDEPSAVDALRARLLIMELTFLDDTVSVEKARSMGHMHISDFIDRADMFQNEKILLMHFSARYAPEEVEEKLQQLPPTLRDRCIPWLAGFCIR